MTYDAKRPFVHICGSVAPYSARFFEAIATAFKMDLNVLACAGREPHRGWEIPAPRNYSLKEIPGLRLHRDELSNIYLNPSVLREMIRLRPGVISIGSFSPTMILAALYAIATRTPLGIGTDGSIESDPGRTSRVHRWVRQLLVPRATVGIAASQASRELLEHFGLPSERCIIVPLVTAWDSPSEIPGFEDRPYDVLFCGTINERKGADFFGEVLKRCKAKGRTVSARIIGHGPLQEDLEKSLAEAGIPARFDGYLQAEDLPAAYGSAKLFLFPSRSDPWGLVANEAILCGTPVIGSPHAVSSVELVGPYEAGLVLPLDVEAWSDAVIETLDSKERWLELQGNHARACGSFSVERAVAAFRDILETIDEPPTNKLRSRPVQTAPRDLLAAGLKAMHASRSHQLFAPHYRGLGAIFMLHRVDPVSAEPGSFAPHRHLSITPDYLTRVIGLVRAMGYDTVALDEVPERLEHPRGRPFAAFTLDDGYRDNLLHAYPVFRTEDVPFTIYVPSQWPEGRGELWWRALEEVIAGSRSIEPRMEGLSGSLPAGTVDEKARAFEAIQRALVQMDEAAKYAHTRDLAGRYGVDLAALCRSEIMTWDEIRELSQDPLVTIGAHTRTHAALSKIDDTDLRREIAGCRAELEAALGRPCRHLAYPYGSADMAGPREFAAAADAGFLTAVTARRGLLYAEHSRRLTALPRIALEGQRQDERCIEVQLSGAPFALRNGLRHHVA